MKSTTSISSNIWLLILLIVVLIGVNQYLIIDIGQDLGISYFKVFQAKAKINITGDISKDAVTLIMSTGVPDIYGEEMGLQYSNPRDSKLMDQMIAIMKQYDPDYGKNKIILEGDLKQRYIDVNIKISCEYCCGAKSIIYEDGKGACGCAHSQAMRGLTAYLLQYHADELTNDEMLRELSRWKGLYFPKQMMKKLMTQLQSGEFTHDISSLLLDVDKEKLLKDVDLENIPLPSEIENLPGMSGGC